MRLNSTTLKNFFPPAYFQRGLAYFNDGRVKELHVVNERRLHSVVSGSGSNRYTTRIELLSSDGQLQDIKGQCSCPVGYNCKHIVATLLSHLQHQPAPKRKPFDRPSDKWLYKLKAVRAEPSTGRSSTECLLYILDLQNAGDGKYLQVKTVKTRRGKDGGYTPGSPHSANPHSQAHYMREDDKFVLLVLNSLKSVGGMDEPRLEGVPGARAFQALIETGRCHWEHENGVRLQHAGIIETRLYWQMQADASQVIRAQNQEEGIVLLPLDPPYYLNPRNGDCGKLDCGMPHSVSCILLASPAVGPAEVEKVARFIDDLGDAGIPPLIRPELHNVKGIEPKPCLRLLNEKEQFFHFEGDDTVGVAVLSFAYDGIYVHPFSDTTLLIRQKGDEFESIQRDLKLERDYIDALDAIGLITDSYDLDLAGGLRLEPVHAVNTWLDFMLQHRALLQSRGWRIDIDDDFVFQVNEARGWYADVEESSHDWLTLELGVDVDGENINLLPLLVNYLQNLKGTRALHDMQRQADDYPLLFKQENGQLLHVPLAKVRHIVDTLVELYQPNALDAAGRLRLSRQQSAQLVDLNTGTQDINWRGGDSLLQFGERLKNFSSVHEVTPPATLQTELRDYQKQGLNWLQFLREFHLGGILADDMGLGKTVQALAHLLVEKETGRACDPSLVVAPTSLMVNWKREAARFAPNLAVLVLQGSDRRQYFQHIADSDIVLTTYPLLSRDTEVLLQQSWHVVILDEAQHIKNPKSKATLTVRQLQAQHRLCLTGTPMENHLGELWSQFHFLIPGLLGEEKQFRQLFRKPIEKHQDAQRQQQLRQRVAPFMLRRNKAEVARELPPKSEILSQVELDGPQRDLYETIRVSMHDRIRTAIDQQGIQRSQIVILDALLKLRQVCCHPQLLKMQSAQRVRKSAKLNQLMEMLPEMVEEGRRILLFSQFTSMLAIIEQELQRHGIGFVKLTGQTRNRETPIDDFQSGRVPVFLISLKAGGSGLNLTAADTVIHYDPWWNPAVENQATDRAHRIGQDKPVFVYKLITVGTVEEKIIALQQNKQALADALFEGGSQAASISAKDLQALFEPLG